MRLDLSIKLRINKSNKIKYWKGYTKPGFFINYREFFDS